MLGTQEDLKVPQICLHIFFIVFLSQNELQTISYMIYYFLLLLFKKELFSEGWLFCTF